MQDEERKAATAEVKVLEQQQGRCSRAVETQIEALAGARRRGELVRRLDQTRKRIGSTERLVSDADRIRGEAKEHELLAAADAKLRDGIAALAASRGAEDAAAKARQLAGKIERARLQREAGAAHRAAAVASRQLDASSGEAAALAGALPAVAVVVDQRTELAEAEADVQATGTVAELDAVLERFGAHLRELETAAAKAVAARDAAAKAQAMREAEREEAERQLRARQEAGDEAVCSRCGQPVDEAHRAAELKRAQHDVESAQRASADARDRRAVLAEAAATATTARDDAVELRRQAELRRTEARAAGQRLRRARAAMERAVAAAAFANWDDERRAVFATADAQELAWKLAELRSELENLNGRVASSRKAVAKSEQAARLADEAHDKALERHAELERAAETASSEAASQQRHATVLLADVPAEWADRARACEKDVLAPFEARRAVVAGAAGKLAALEDAEAELVKLRASVDELTEQLKALPASHQLSVSSAQEALAAARGKLAATERALGDARMQTAALKDRDEARAAKLAEQARTGREARLAARMVALLGRQGLQGQLLHAATGSLETLANETLTTLTGGALQLEIRFVDQRGRDELSVYARDFNAGGERTDAAFLSGSEKFRVCVAMAAAIGAYGSGRQRVESLIIDEGFGNLDEQRRGDMIDELRRLAGLLERVIVVSHQADFQNRAQFPHGYRLRRVDGATTVERYI